MILLAALLLQAAAPGNFVHEEESEHLHFHYGWSAAAEAVPALAAALRARMAAAKARAMEMAAEGRGSAAGEGWEMPAHSHEQDWSLDGSTAQLMSLSAGVATYAGGAHGNLAYEALLWDRLSDRPVAAAALLGAGLERMTARYCDALDRQREEKRGEPVRRDPADPHTACPTLAGRVLAPADSDGNGRFDRLNVLIPPYAAGPYVEGDYVVEIPFHPGDLAAIPDGYRPAFEVPGERIAPLPAEEPPPDPQCPVMSSGFVRAADDVCFGEAGPNHFFAFVYPRAAARIPALDGLLRAEKDLALSDFSSARAYAREHSDLRLFEEYLYRVDADRPQLLALSYRMSNYQGGAHGDHGGGTLIWDRAENRRIQFEDLFVDSGAASSEVARLLCPSFNEVRRRAFERGGGHVVDRCPEPPYGFALLALPGGRIETLRLFFAQLDGYAGGSYTVTIPVTPRLIAALHPRFRDAFAPSDVAPLACNSNLPDERCR